MSNMVQKTVNHCIFGIVPNGGLAKKNSAPHLLFFLSQVENLVGPYGGNNPDMGRRYVRQLVRR